MTSRIDIGREFVMSCLSLFLYTGRIRTRFSESVKTHLERDLFIKFDCIGARTLTLALIMFVTILFQPTVVLLLSL